MPGTRSATGNGGGQGSAGAACAVDVDSQVTASAALINAAKPALGTRPATGRLVVMTLLLMGLPVHTLDVGDSGPAYRHARYPVSRPDLARPRRPPHSLGCVGDRFRCSVGYANVMATSAVQRRCGTRLSPARAASRSGLIEGTMAGVADWLPRYDVRERHQCVIPLQPERALANALDTPVCPDRLV